LLLFHLGALGALRFKGSLQRRALLFTFSEVLTRHKNNKTYFGEFGRGL